MSSLALVFVLAGCSDPRSGTVHLEDYRGQWVVINYWAEWCKPCATEIPELNALAGTYPEVAVLGVNFDGAVGEELAAQERRLGVAFPTLASDPAADLGVARPAVLPTTLILDPEGAVADTLVGPQTLESLAQATRQSPVRDGEPEEATGNPDH
jgi:thiol-disulfide isomerase/thioredoxin